MMTSQTTTHRIFAVKTTGGQERSVANFIYNRSQLRHKPIYSVLVLDSMKGYIFVEAPNAQVVGDATAGFRHVKSTVPGIMQPEDIEKFLVTKPIIAELHVSDTVEIVSGPFKGMRAKITRVETTKQEVTIVLLDAPYQLPVTVDANYLKMIEKART